MGNERIEAATLAAMTKGHSGDIECGSVVRLGKASNFRTRHVENLRAGVDEAPNEPRAGDAVDPRSCAGDPTCGRAGWLRLHAASGRTPAFDAVVQILRL
jgi:hypothetical protein